MVDGASTLILQQGWKSAQQLNFGGDLSRVWTNFIDSLQRAHVRISEREDELIWDLDPASVYNPKVGYTFISVEHFNRDLK